MLRVLREQLLPMPAPNDDGAGELTKKPREREAVKTP
jgi:hypothetical protein